MIQQHANGDWRAAGKLVIRQLPTSQLAIYVFIEIQPPPLDERQHSDRADRFTDRSGLKESRRCNGPTRAHVCDAIPSCPRDLAAINHCHAESRNPVRPHTFSDRVGDSHLLCGDRQQTILDPSNPGIRLSTNRNRRSQQREGNYIQEALDHCCSSRPERCEYRAAIPPGAMHAGPT